MKFSLAFAYLTAATAIFTALAFNKPTVAVTYYYKSEFNYQRLLYGTISTDLLERSIEQNAGFLFTSPSSWQTSPVSFTLTLDMTKYIGAITFDEENTADGGCDGQLTLQEALNALYDYYFINHSMPQTLIVCNAVIYVTYATEAH